MCARRRKLVILPPDLPLETLYRRQPWLTRLCFFLGGALLMLSFAPFGWYPLALILLLPVLYAFFHLQPGQAARLGFAFGAGLFLAGTYWLYVSIHVFGQAPLILAIFLMLCLVVIMAVYYAACGWLIARLSAGSYEVVVRLGGQERRYSVDLRPGQRRVVRAQF